MSNIFSDIPDELPQELFDCLVEGEHVRIERIVSKGHASPATGWYDQSRAEWVMVLRGQALISYPDKPSITLGEGDYVNIAAHEQHRVEWTSAEEATIWLAVHY